MIPRLAVSLLVAFLAVAATPDAALAHNALVTSDPPDGAIVDASPAALRLTFEVAVPLDTLSIEYIDGAGIRSELEGFTHGSAGDTDISVPLPQFQRGEVNLRWRLVGPDGHPITGRISFTIDPVATGGTTADSSGTEGPDAFSEPWTTPSSARWLLRYTSYLALIALIGLITTWRYVWPGVRHDPWVTVAMPVALTVVTAAAVAQVLVIASDISGSPPWLAMDGLTPALSTGAARALLVRAATMAALGAAIAPRNGFRPDVQQMVGGGLLLVALGTWAFAGHSRSMRLPQLGVPLDVAHHAAAAAWIGGLALVGLIGLRRLHGDELLEVVNRFARLAPVAVAVILATGTLQAVRLVGGPWSLFTVGHGRYLLVKLLVLGLMLKAADVNRRRVQRRFRSTVTVTPLVMSNLRRAMATELATGLVVIAITAFLVVAPPATAGESAAPAPGDQRSVRLPALGGGATIRPTHSP